MYLQSFFNTQKRFIEDKPTEANESGLMFSNFKKYVQDVFPTKISEEQWKDILGEVKFNIIMHTQLQYIGEGRRYGIWGGRMVDIEVLNYPHCNY